MSKIHENLMARFADHEPSLVSAHHGKLFESCLAALASTERLGEMMAAAEGDDFWFKADDWRSMYRPYNVKNGILQIPVQGVLLSKFPWAIGSWATGYRYIAKAWERGMADPEVKGIALVIHTPGGEVAENFDLVDRMHATRDAKPTISLVHEYAYSAGYSIGSVASKVVVSRTGGVGSIGVVTSHVDVSAMMEKMGWKVTFISAPEDGFKTDGNPYEALKPETRARIQARVNELYDIFVKTVARNREMSEEDVRETKALTFTATQGQKLGLADGIATFDDALAAFAEEIDNRSSTGVTAMADIKKEDHDKAVAAARDEGMTAGRAEGAKAGATGERERINAIIGSEEGKDRPKAALSAAIKTNMSVEEAKAFLADLPKEKAETATTDKAKDQDDKGGDKASGDNGQKFDAAMRQHAPGVGAGKEEDGEKAEDQGDGLSALAKSFGLPGFAN